MARTRRKRNTSSSLELLLDTMTNAFGGVLFLAILISIQLRDRTAEPVIEQPTFETEINQLKSKIRIKESKLETAIARKTLSEELGKQFHDEDSFKLQAVLDDLKTRAQESRSQVENSSAEINAISKLQSESAERIRRVSDELESMDKKLRESTNELELEKGKRTLAGRLPKRRRSSKLPINIGLKNGRFYEFEKNGTYNEDDFDIQSSTFGKSLLPKSNGGKPLGQISANYADMIRESVGADNRRYFVTIVVWEDTFDHFQDVKQAIIDAGFEYRLLLLSGNTPVGTGNTGPTYTQ